MQGLLRTKEALSVPAVVHEQVACIAPRAVEDARDGIEGLLLPEGTTVRPFICHAPRFMAEDQRVRVPPGCEQALLRRL